MGPIVSANTIQINEKIEAVDLFCGVGGLTYGLRQAGIDVVAGIDNDETCRYAYETNNEAEFINADITQYSSKEVAKLYAREKTRVLVGCAPCQPFSSHTFKNKKHDTRWDLLLYFGKFIDEILPEIVSMENVRGIVKTSVFHQFLGVLKKHHYYVDYNIVYTPDYGVPQNRYRLVLLASRLGPIKLPNPTHTKDTYATVGQTIAHLPPIKAGETLEADPLHKARNLTEINMQRIQQSKPNGTWRDWDESLLPACYRKKSGQTYMSVYGRMDWNGVAPTITTQFFNYGAGRFGHPTQDRALSLREGALLQTFPPDYDFGEVKSMEAIGRHIGNAVPPLLGEVIGKTIREHVNEYHSHAEPTVSI